jgi:NAD(P)-dependent dehydrogenase (short-subunit alcohol dehydrogenase family)
MSLQGKNALVIGSSRGIGRGIAQSTLNIGGRVVSNIRTESDKH